MKSIVLINCYFGKFPDFFFTFLESCRRNPTINFIFFTDNSNGNLPDNVEFINISFSELRKKIQSKFSFEIVLNSPYKLCDYKPAYGYIFEDYISRYDFWGYCDIDMIFGDIRKFITDEILLKNEKIYQLGHLSLYRNTKDNNRVFMADGNPNYREAFTTDVITVFDEVDGIQKKYQELGINTYIKRDYADITPRYYQFKLSNAFVDLKNNNYKKQIFLCKEGKIYRAYVHGKQIVYEEFIYIHFQKRKMSGESFLSDVYLITNKGFIPIKDYKIIDEKMIKKYNGFQINREILFRCKHLFWKIRRKILKMEGKAI